MNRRETYCVILVGCIRFQVRSYKSNVCKPAAYVQPPFLPSLPSLNLLGPSYVLSYYAENVIVGSQWCKEGNARNLDIYILHNSNLGLSMVRSCAKLLSRDFLHFRLDKILNLVKRTLLEIHSPCSLDFTRKTKEDIGERKQII